MSTFTEELSQQLHTLSSLQLLYCCIKYYPKYSGLEENYLPQVYGLTRLSQVVLAWYLCCSSIR